MFKFPDKDEATARWLQKDDTTFNVAEMDIGDRWQYYVSSWARNEPTEGIQRSRMQKAMLTRNFSSGDSESDCELQPKPLYYRDTLALKICVNTSKIIYDSGANYATYKVKNDGTEERAKRQETLEAAMEDRKKFVEKMAMNGPWMKNLSQDAVQQAKEAYQKWHAEGNPPAPQPLDEDWTMVDGVPEHMG